MAERNPFEHKPVTPGAASGAGTGAIHCEQWEEMLVDALDGALSAADRAAFDAHAATCPVCAQLLAQSSRGREWLRFLEAEPEVPAGLVESIVSRTSGSVAAGVAANPLGLGGATQIPALAAGNGIAIPMRRATWNSHMVMTAAMAFFSLALTLNLMLNLAGVRLTDLHLANLDPASMEMNLTRQIYGVKGSVVRYYDNLRLVYEVESRVHQLRRADGMRLAPQPKPVPATPKAGNGVSRSQPAQTREGGTLLGSPQMAESENPASKKPQMHGTEQQGKQMSREEASDEVPATLVTHAERNPA